jgi:hypothetical protein
VDMQEEKKERGSKNYAEIIDQKFTKFVKT